MTEETVISNLLNSNNKIIESNLKVIKKSKNIKLNFNGINELSTKLLTILTNNNNNNTINSNKWSEISLHPIPIKHSNNFICNWIFLVSTLNFSFWSNQTSTSKRFGIKYKSSVDNKLPPTNNKEEEEEEEEEIIHTGYWSLLALLHKALDKGVKILEPNFYKDCSESVLIDVFKSDEGREEIPLLKERIECMREVGTILCSKFKGTYETLIHESNHSAIKLVELIVNSFPCFNDISNYEGETIFLYKRAQILVAETWAAFEGKGLGRFDDIDQITMFADYRVPQILHSLSTLTYSPHLISLLQSKTILPHNSKEEIEIRSFSIVVIEEIKFSLKKLILNQGLGLEGKNLIKVPNSIELDFFLWDLAKIEEGNGKIILDHHRTRSIYY